MKKFRIIILIMSLSFLISCGGSKKDNKKEEQGYKVGVIISDGQDKFLKTLKEKFWENNKRVGLNLEVLDSGNNKEQQLSQIDMLLEGDMDAYAVNLVDVSMAKDVIEKFKSKDKIVIFFNKEPSKEILESYSKAYYVGTESKEAGIIQGQLISSEWSENPNWDLNKDGIIQYVILKGEPGHPDAEARTEWVVKVLEENGFKVEELGKDTAMWDKMKAKKVVDQWIKESGNKIELVISNNDAMALGALESLNENGKIGIPVFGVDALSEAIQKVKSGEMAGTVLNDAKNQADAILKMASNLSQGKGPVEGTRWRIEGNKVVRIPYVAVNKVNVLDF